MVSLVVAGSHTPDGALLAAFGYPWLGAYSAYVLGRRATLVHLSLISVGFGAGLLANDAPDRATAWLVVSATVWAIAQLLGGVAARLRDQADTDALTGLLNRNGLLKAARREIALAGRTGLPLTLAVIDIDDFKAVNDRDGHRAGDRLLVTLARGWRKRLRATDILGRPGGDEFVLLLPATAAEDADAVLARLRDGSRATWSVGATGWRPGEDLDSWLARAERALSLAKATGSPQPAVFGPERAIAKRTRQRRSRSIAVR